jgi:putative aminopeptidase FrvX
MTLSNEDQQLALTLTGIPTAAGLEDRVIEFLEGWLFMRSARLRVQRDDGGNLLITQRGAPRGMRPLLITAHLDHPAFVVRRRIVHCMFSTSSLEAQFNRSKVARPKIFKINS